MQITPSEVFKLIGTLTVAELRYAPRGALTSKTLLKVHESVEQYLGTKIEFEIKKELFYESLPGELL